MRVHGRVRVSKETVLQNGTVIGHRGMSFVRNCFGEIMLNEQSHGVFIDDGVEIGANCTIHRGGWRDTVIHAGCVLGSQVNIGHNVILHENVVVAPMTTIAGSVEVGEGATIWQGVSIASRLKIGKGAVIGMGAVVLEDVPAGETWAGNPARRIK